MQQLVAKIPNKLSTLEDLDDSKSTGKSEDFQSGGGLAILWDLFGSLYTAAAEY